MKMLALFAGLFCLSFAVCCEAALVGQVIEYPQGETVLEGYMVYDDAIEGKRPGVMVVHDWMGVGPFVRQRADALAKLGYVAFAADIYGKGVRPSTAQEASQQASVYKSDRVLLRNRVEEGLVNLRRHPLVDQERIAAIGYCFGGMAVLEMARAGLDLEGVVSFHGTLDAPMPAQVEGVKPKILVLHGAEDPFVPPAEVQAFKAEMANAGADLEFVVYPNAMHSFTNPDADATNMAGVKYNQQADESSWRKMQFFFNDIFSR